MNGVPFGPRAAGTVATLHSLDGMIVGRSRRFEPLVLRRRDDEVQALQPLDRDRFTHIRARRAGRLPQLAEHTDGAVRAARRDDLRTHPDHRLTPRLRPPPARKAATPDHLADLEQDAAEQDEEVPRPWNEEREHDRQEKDHAC